MLKLRYRAPAKSMKAEPPIRELMWRLLTVLSPARDIQWPIALTSKQYPQNTVAAASRLTRYCEQSLRPFTADDDCGFRHEVKS